MSRKHFPAFGPVNPRWSLTASLAYTSRGVKTLSLRKFIVTPYNAYFRACCEFFASPTPKALICSVGLSKNSRTCTSFMAYFAAQRKSNLRASSSLTFSTGWFLPNRTKAKNWNALLNVRHASNSLMASGSLDLQGLDVLSSRPRMETVPLRRTSRPLELILFTTGFPSDCGEVTARGDVSSSSSVLFSSASLMGRLAVFLFKIANNDNNYNNVNNHNKTNKYNNYNNMNINKIISIIKITPIIKLFVPFWGLHHRIGVPLALDSGGRHNGRCAW